MKKKEKIEKPVKEMNFEEILERLREKEFKSIKFDFINKPFQTWEDFYKEYAPGEEIHEQWMGGVQGFTFIWKGKDRYPFACVFPKEDNEDGCYFSLRKD
jgi:hypothetical protein